MGRSASLQICKSPNRKRTIHFASSSALVLIHFPPWPHVLPPSSLLPRRRARRTRHLSRQSLRLQQPSPSRTSGCNQPTSSCASMSLLLEMCASSPMGRAPIFTSSFATQKVCFASVYVRLSSDLLAACITGVGFNLVASYLSKYLKIGEVWNPMIALLFLTC